MSKLRIRGYCDRPNVAPGDSLGFYVSSDDPGEYTAELVRLVNGDLNPQGPGPREDLIANPVNGTYPREPAHADGWIHRDPRSSRRPRGPWQPERSCLHQLHHPLARPPGHRLPMDSANQAGWALMVDEGGQLAFVIGDGSGATSVIRSDRPLFPDTFYGYGGFYAEASTLSLYQASVVSSTNSRFGKVFPLESNFAGTTAAVVTPATADVPVLIAGLAEACGERTWVTNTFNGKIDSPSVYDVALDGNDAARLAAGERIAPPTPSPAGTSQRRSGQTAFHQTSSGTSPATRSTATASISRIWQ